MGIREARPVRLDNLDRVKTIVACNPVFAAKRYPLDTYTVIVPSTGVAMTQSLGFADRPKMSDFALQARTFYELLRFNGPLSPQTLPIRYLPKEAQPSASEDAARARNFAPPFCNVCVASARAGINQVGPLPGQDMLWVCRSCQAIWHNSCARSRTFMGLGHDLPARAVEALGELCPLCGDDEDSC